MMLTAPVVLGLFVVCALLVERTTAAAKDILWIPQFLGNPYEGQYTGIAFADLNADGRPDLLISAGKHWIDQSYVLMNLGPNYRAYGVLVSSPLPLGPPSAHYAVQAGKFASFGWDNKKDGWGVLLAGADCSTTDVNAFGACTPGMPSAAVLLRVTVQGCTGIEDNNDNDCTLDWTVAWKDSWPMGDRNAALAYNLGNGKSEDPAIVLVGNGGAAIFEAPYINNNNNNQQEGDDQATFRITPPQKLPWLPDAIVRGTGLAVGPIGTKYTGFFVGTRSMQAAPPAPVVGVWNTGPSDYAWYSLGNVNNRYTGNPENVAVQATGLVLADLNGDGIQDLIEANHLDGPQRVAGFPIQQDYYLLDQEGFGEPASFAWEVGGGRTVAAGKLFTDTDLPDVVLGTADGYIVWFANLGLDAQGNFLGLQERHRRLTAENCEVRSLQIVPDLVRPCAPSVVAVVYCNDNVQRGGVFSFHDATTRCPSSSSLGEEKDQGVASPDGPAAAPVGQPPQAWNDHGQPQDQALQKDDEEEEGYASPGGVNGVVADTMPSASAGKALYMVHPGAYVVALLLSTGLFV